MVAIYLTFISFSKLKEAEKRGYAPWIYILQELFWVCDFLKKIYMYLFVCQVFAENVAT